jgi:arginine/serine-rich splicing factor 2
MGKGNKTIFVGGIHPDTRARDLAREFERFGPILRCEIPTPGGVSKGYGFVEFENDRDAEEAIRHLRGKLIEGRAVTIEV